ncbi:MAG: hypothetical protein K0Q72_3826 [Armatimonadetes bacterium]|jgi:hypothetical protein|nr:hypothetical protein [Armatimonadota bacterium]
MLPSPAGATIAMQPDPTEELSRRDLRPGLTMVKRRTLKEDGRYLIYYDFERQPAPHEAERAEKP